MIVKICGLTRPEDVDACGACGVDWIGLNLWPASKRYVGLDVAVDLAGRARAAGLSPVALLVKPTTAEVAETWAAGAFDRLQLYDAPADLPAGLPWIRCLTVGDRLPDDTEPTSAGWDLIETEVAGRGGAGQCFDWALLEDWRPARPTLIAGGLTPSNVVNLLRRVCPWGIDLASGVESAPGVKDPDKIRTLMEAVRNAPNEAR